MSDEAFLRAIQDQPGDPLPRLAYADWLEERDDPRGEYLRLFARVETALKRMATLRSGINTEWVSAATGRFLVLLRAAEWVQAIEIRSRMLVIGRDGRFYEVVDRELSPIGVFQPWLALHLKDVSKGQDVPADVVRYRPDEELQVVRFLSEHDWQET